MSVYEDKLPTNTTSEGAEASGPLTWCSKPALPGVRLLRRHLGTTSQLFPVWELLAALT